MSRTATYIYAVIVVVMAISYFSLSYNKTSISIDEEYLLYNHQRTAEGQIPHRDFYDDYGPAIYWLGGGLFKLFGSRVIILRVFALVLKAAMALLIFLIAKKILPNSFALIAGVLYILSWGDPSIPAMSVLYAGSVSHFLALVGILWMIMYIETERRIWLFGIGACVGLSMLFKFHAAVFDLIGFAVFLSLKEHMRNASDEASGVSGENSGPVLIPLMRGGKCIGVLAVVLFYVALFARDHLDLYYFFIFLVPYFLLLGHLLFNDIRGLQSKKAGTPATKRLKNCYVEMAILLIGPLAFLSFEVLFYYYVNGLDELIYDTFALPMAMNFYKPMADYRLHAGLVAASATVVLILIGIGKKVRERSEIEREFFWALSFVLALLVPGVLIFRNTSFDEWQMRATSIIPPATLLLVSYLFLTTWRRQRALGGAEADTLVVGLLFIFACQGFMMSFPRTDTTHIQFNSTVIFILVIFLLWKLNLWWKALFSARGTMRSLVFVGACIATLVAPLLWSMKIFYVFSPEIPEHLRNEVPASVLYELEAGTLKSYPHLKPDLPRAAGLNLPLWPTRHFTPFVANDKFEIAHIIRGATRPDEEIFVMCEAQILYFLTERHTCVPKENYFAYLAVVGLIDNADSVRLTDEQLLRQLAKSRPRFIIRIRRQYGGHTEKIARIWPRAAAFVETAYEPVAVYSIFEIVQPRGFSQPPAH